MLQVGILSLNQVTETNSNEEVEALKKEIAELKQMVTKLSKEIKERPREVKPLTVENSQFKMDFFGEAQAQTTKRPAVEQSRIVLPEYVKPGELTIEDVLTTATKQAKAEVEAVWQQLNPVHMMEHKEVISFLKEGIPVAAAPNGFVLIFKHEPACKRLLREENKQQAHQIIHHFFKRPYNFIVMPESFWLEQRQSFIEQKNAGKQPVLNQYSQDVENVINYKEEPVKAKETLLSQMTQMYGEELVNIIDE